MMLAKTMLFSKQRLIHQVDQAHAMPRQQEFLLHKACAQRCMCLLQSACISPGDDARGDAFLAAHDEEVEAAVVGADESYDVEQAD